MAYSINIQIPGSSPRRIALSGSSGMIGSASSNPVRIDHPEVSPQALVLDVRGNDFWIQNLNPYSIYVGMEEVTPNAWHPWSPAETIQLTQSVSLTLINEVAATSASSGAREAEDESSGFDMGKMFQIVVIGICFLGAAFLLFSPKSDVAGVIDREFDFNSTVEELQLEGSDIEMQTVRRYLQQAWMADRRWRLTRPDLVMKYYELLVNHRLVRENSKANSTLDAIATYAKRRLSDLRFGKRM